VEKILILLFLVFLTPAYGGEDVINIPLQTKVLNLNPSGVQDAWSIWVSRQLNCQLVRSEGQDLSFDAAKDAKFTTPTQLVFTLREKYFADGTRVKAADVIATLEWLKKHRQAFRNLFGWISSIKSDATDRVVINLTHPAPQFLKSFAAPNYGIFPERFLKAAAANPAEWNKPIGCGSYRIDKVESSTLTLSPLKKGRPIKFDLLEGGALSEANLRKYEIIPPPFFTHTSVPAGYTRVDSFDPKQVLVAVNTKIPRWKTRAARCKLLAGISATGILREYGAEAESTSSLFPRGVIGFNAGKKFGVTDVISAAQKKGGCIGFLGLSIPESLRRPYIVEAEKAFSPLKTIVFNEVRNFGPDFLKSGCDILVVGYKSNYLDGYEFLMPFTGTSTNITGYEGLAGSIQQSQEMVDTVQRAQAYETIENKILSECLAKPILTIPKLSFLLKSSSRMPGIGRAPLSEFDLSAVQ
jgi:hypothetical protein